MLSRRSDNHTPIKQIGLHRLNRSIYDYIGKRKNAKKTGNSRNYQSFQYGMRAQKRYTRRLDEKLWHAVAEPITVYNDDRLVYLLKDGSEITVML